MGLNKRTSNWWKCLLVVKSLIRASQTSRFILTSEKVGPIFFSVLLPPHQFFSLLFAYHLPMFTPLTFLLQGFLVIDSESEMANNPAAETQPTSPPSRLSDLFYDQTFSSPTEEELASTLTIERQYTSCVRALSGRERVTCRNRRFVGNHTS